MGSAGRSVEVSVVGSTCVWVDGEEVALTTFQRALVTAVFVLEHSSRVELAQMLWATEVDGRTRHRLRQLISTTSKRTGLGVLQTAGDVVRADDTAWSDARVIREAASGHGSLEPAAKLLARGVPGATLVEMPDEFLDRMQTLHVEWARKLSVRAEIVWTRGAAREAWLEARDAAEAMSVLNPIDGRWVARLIQVRGRLGYDRAAEVGYADYLARLGPNEPAAEVGDAIQAIRSMPAVLDREEPYPEPSFVGRQVEQEEMRRVFDVVRRGEPTFALIVGEAGIGKTRLLDQIRRTAHLDGFRCLSAKAVEFERVIALSPVVDALQEIDVDRLATALGEPWRTVIGQMLPAAWLRKPVGEPPRIQERNLPRRLFDAFAMLFEQIASDRPTILFLDDLHWADQTSVDLLRFIHRRSTDYPFGVIATVRPEAVGTRDPCWALLDPRGGASSHRLDLGELTDTEARTLLSEVLADEADSESTEALLTVAGFHPLYLTELGRDHLARGLLDQADSRLEPIVVPLSLREILNARTSRVSERASTLLAFLSAGAGSMRLGELASLTDHPIDTIVELAEELQNVGLARGERDHIWISHDLFRAAIYSEMSEPRRAVVHSKIGTHLQRTNEAANEEIATHLDRAGERAAAAKHGWAAGEHCLERGAVAEAAYFFQLTARNEIDPGRVALATAKHGVSLHLQRDMARAGPALELAAARLREAGRSKAALRLEIRRAEALAEQGETPTTDLLDRLLSIKGEATAHQDWEALALALDAELQLRHASGDLQGIEQVFSQCRQIVSRGDSAASAVAHSVLALQVVFANPTAGLADARVALRLTEALPEHRLRTLLRVMAVRQLQGRIMEKEFTAIVQEARARAKTSGDIRVRFSVESNLAVGALDAGELDRAEALFESSSKLLGTAEMGLARFNHANNRGELALARGDYSRARHYFSQASTYVGPTTPRYASSVVAAGLGLCAMELGDLSEARKRGAMVSLPTPPYYYDPSTLVAFEVRRLERARRVEEGVDLLTRVTDHLEGRLVLAWLKLLKVLVQKLTGREATHEHAMALAQRGLACAQDLGLGVRTVEFGALLRNGRAL